MNSTLSTYSYKSPALYNPRLWNANEVRAYYVARPTLLDRIVEDLKRESTDNHPQHRLIVGLRGMGKSTLLRRIAVAVEDDAPLNATWLPLSFPEEQYNVASLSDFWLNCLDALSDLLESRGEMKLSATLDAEVEHLDRKDGEGALGALLRAANTQQRRLLLLVDNIDLIFDRIKAEDWKLRDALQANPEILIVGASAKVLEDTYDYKAAFYDFFKVDELRGLTEAEMRETIVNLAQLGNAQHIIDRIDADPARLRVLHTLTGGNPRTAVLLYGVLLKGIDGDVRSDLEGLLDEVTPLYKARFEELPAQSQQLLDKLALHWHPANASTLAKQLAWKVNLVSAQLDRLVNAGIVERVKAPKSKRLNFQIGERFFNIWYLMRTSRRMRRRLIWLVECLRGLYTSEELRAIAKARLKQPAPDIREAETLVALSDALDEIPYKRALTDQVLDFLNGDASGRLISELFDLDGVDQDIRNRYAMRSALSVLRTGIESVLEDTANHELFDHFDVGFLTKKSLRALSALSEDNTSAISDIADLVRAEARHCELMFGRRGTKLLASTMRQGGMESLNDIEGGAASAIRYGEPYLSATPIAISSIPTAETASDVERCCHTMLNYDRTGFYPWLCLLSALGKQRKRTEAQAAAMELASAPSFPANISLLGLTYLVALNCKTWTSLVGPILHRLNPSSPEDIDALVALGNVAVATETAAELLTIVDDVAKQSIGELLPFREALNAASNQDVSLLELLAPEVKEPAKNLLARIAPSLAQRKLE